MLQSIEIKRNYGNSIDTIKVVTDTTTVEDEINADAAKMLVCCGFDLACKGGEALSLLVKMYLEEIQGIVNFTINQYQQ
jgi:hypothetical protein